MSSNQETCCGASAVECPVNVMGKDWGEGPVVELITDLISTQGGVSGAFDGGTQDTSG